MRIVSLIIVIILLITGISFACLNAEKVIINYYFGSRALPLSILLLLSLCLGALLAFILQSFAYLKLHFENKRLKKQLHQIQTSGD